MLGRVKMNNTLLTYDKGNFNQMTARSWNRTVVTMVRDTSTTTVPPAARTNYRYPGFNYRVVFFNCFQGF